VSTGWRIRFSLLWKSYRWVAVACAGVAAFVLGLDGYARYFALHQRQASWADLVYLSFLLFKFGASSLEHPVPWQLETARFLAPAAAIGAAVETLVALFREKFLDLRLHFVRRHVVVCGLGAKGSLFVKRFVERGYSVVAIERDGKNPSVPLCQKLGVPVVIGDAADPLTLERARVARARHLVATCPDDGVNAEVALVSRGIVRKPGTPFLAAHVHVVDVDLCLLLREREIASSGRQGVRIEFFNVYQNGVRAMLALQGSAWQGGAGAGAHRPHLLVVGFGRFGRELVLQAGRNWHLEHGAAGKRLRITVVDSAAEEGVRRVSRRYPGLAASCDLEPLSLDTSAPVFEEARFLRQAVDGHGLSAVFICLSDNSKSLAAALMLSRHLKGSGVPIVVRLSRTAGLASLLSRDGSCSDAYGNLYAFGLLDGACTVDLLLGGTNEVLAQALHEEYVRARERELAGSGRPASLVPWQDLPERLRESNRRQADGIAVKLKAVGCELTLATDWGGEASAFAADEIEVMARMEHERWAEDLSRDGWTYAAGAKSEERRTHPGLRAWGDLPESEREIDRSFIRGLPVFLGRAGFRIVRSQDNSCPPTD